MSKERWFRNYERELSERLDNGLSWEAASEVAVLRAEEETREQMSEIADRLYDVERERGWELDE